MRAHYSRSVQDEVGTLRFAHPAGLSHTLIVMPGLVPGIHDLWLCARG
jgi:hypothetical protein